MGALTAAAFAVTLAERWIEGKKRHTRGTLTLTGGSDTYPTGGIPLPTLDKFGFIQRIDTLVVFGKLGSDTVNYAPTYDKVNHKLQLYSSHDTAGATTLPMDEQDTSEAPGTKSWYFEATGW